MSVARCELPQGKLEYFAAKVKYRDPINLVVGSSGERLGN
jgi:hypothetical protein